MAQQSSSMNRRTLLQVLPASLLVTETANTGQTHCPSQPPPSTSTGPYSFQFLTPREAAALDLVMESMIPADQHSPGAHAAKVVEYADTMIATGSETAKSDWRTGLTLLLQDLEQTSAEEWLATAAQNEDNPQSVREIFFRTVKQMTINGYYSSTVGIHEDLQYQGNTYVVQFIGCQHPEHGG